ncbi:MAG: F0F1 ATP synthase subunit delta [Microgenomates group bacterium GW2011_GWA2_47_8]|nr:MAG: F0F1 ATP synthase subunit delta [Microgenomates group bacterium GW2011_GWA2_47_8]
MFLPKVRELLRKVTASAKKQQIARVESAAALTPRERQTIEAFLGTLLAHPVTLECRVNSATLGGILIRVGDWILDTTLLGQLQAMKESLV